MPINQGWLILKSSEQFDVLPLVEVKELAAPLENLSVLTLPMPIEPAAGNLSNFVAQRKPLVLFQPNLKLALHRDNFFAAIVFLVTLLGFSWLVSFKKICLEIQLSDDKKTFKSDIKNVFTNKRRIKEMGVQIEDVKPRKFVNKEKHSYKDAGVQADESASKNVAIAQQISEIASSRKSSCKFTYTAPYYQGSIMR
ncbi:MAG: hypothetical protein Q9191_001330 [Dirinaria sp. TL-2023a]